MSGPEFVPITPRVAKWRERYRTTVPKMCTARMRIVTDFYKSHPELRGPLKTALTFKEIAEKVPVLINEDELIAGSMASTYRGSCLFPEQGIDWFKTDYDNGNLFDRHFDPYIIDPEDAEYVLGEVDYWNGQSMSAIATPYLPEGYYELAGSGVCLYMTEGDFGIPVGHFCTNYDKACTKGFAAVGREAREKMRELERTGIDGEYAEAYTFYRCTAIVCEAMVTFTKRYAAEAQRLADAEADPRRKAELERMADTFSWINENPCRDFRDAIQCIFLYQIGMCLNNNQHGISLGRVDQYLGKYYEADLAAGRITPEEAQELVDLFMLKVAEMNKIWGSWIAQWAAGYTCGQLITIGGTDREGNDITNPVTYMLLQASGRLLLHDPPLSLRISKQTPAELWDLAIETTRRAGGIPTFENDDVIIPALMQRGMSRESANNYCLIGCVEPGGTGDDWPCCGTPYFNMATCFLAAINNGTNPYPPQPDGSPARRTGLETGYLYEMETFDEVLAAVKAQMEFFLRWQISVANVIETQTAYHQTRPLVSAMMDGCMESGKDVMRGGAVNNGFGLPGIAFGTIVDSLAITRYLCFDKKVCTTRELYDALMNNWEGYEELHEYIRNECPHFGNADPYCDELATWVGDVFCGCVNNSRSMRGQFTAGLYPVATHVAFGLTTAATPDGRYLGQPLSDGISPVQQMDKNGPTATLTSVAYLNQVNCPNGTLLNMKFHQASFVNEQSREKLRRLIETYFELGGMELQINVTSSETLRAAQKDPDEYKDLVVRVAGFSAYFVELIENQQDDLIARTELEV